DGPRRVFPPQDHVLTAGGKGPPALWGDSSFAGPEKAIAPVECAACRSPRDSWRHRPSDLPMLLYAATIFVSAFLLFLVQPVVAKQILPWFGGSAAVWTTCLVFFQTALLAGYTY